MPLSGYYIGSTLYQIGRELIGEESMLATFPIDQINRNRAVSVFVRYLDLLGLISHDTYYRVLYRIYVKGRDAI